MYNPEYTEIECNTGQMVFSKEYQTFSTDSSDLGIPPGVYPQVIKLTSVTSKVTKTFIFEEYYTGDGDLKDETNGWYYKDTDSDLRILIFND